ncbi:MAG: porin family protein [Bacteroidetes bacterium]|nr:porin family protein [Bacteroidota bacterium]
MQKRLIPVFILLFFTLTVSGQRRQVMNLPKYDRARIHFGFVLGLNISKFKVEPVGDLRIRDTVYSIIPRGTSGLNLGIISNLKLGEHFDLRFIPALAFTQRNLEYSMVYTDSNFSRETITKQVESTYLEFPLELKFKSTRIDNYRVYVLAGWKYAIDMVSQAKVLAKDKEIVKLNKHDYGYEIGVGFDFYMTYFKFSPELKMYNGLTNLLVQDGRRFSNPLNGLSSKAFVISFTFE